MVTVMVRVRVGRSNGVDWCFIMVRTVGALDDLSGANLCSTNKATPYNPGGVANLFIIFIIQRVLCEGRNFLCFLFHNHQLHNQEYSCVNV